MPKSRNQNRSVSRGRTSQLNNFGPQFLTTIMLHTAIPTLNTTLAFLMYKLPKPTNVKVHLQDNTLITTTSLGIPTTDRYPEVQIKIMLPSIRMPTLTNRKLLTTKEKILIVILPLLHPLALLQIAPISIRLMQDSKSPQTPIWIKLK